MKYLNITKIILLLVIFSNLFTGFVYAENNKKTGYYIDKNFDLIPNDKSLNKKVVLITIDDGPGKTDKDLIDTLDKHKAKAIFFINGVHNKNFKDNIKMIHDKGFTIGNHTWSHLNLKHIKDDKIKKEILDNNRLIYEITGEKPKFFRPPYGVINTYAKNLVNKEGMVFMNWSGSALDWEKNSRQEKIFIKNITDKLHDGEIILLHGHQWTVKFLDHLLSTIEEMGYSFANPIDIIH